MLLRLVFVFAMTLVPIRAAQHLVPPPDATAKVDRIFSTFAKAGSPGCTVGAAIDGVTVLSAAYGMADLERNVPLTPQSVLEAGSVSKQFTAGAILLLVQQGKLSLDDPVRKYIPELPDYGTVIIIRHLLNHTSGLRDWGDVEAIAGWPRTTRVYTHSNVLEIVSRQRALNFQPGADFSYTNTGFNLLAILAERASGKSFQDLSREAIFAPLGMSSTQWRDDFRRIVPNRAIAYAQNRDSIRELMPFENVFGNGGLLTTVGDLLKWNQNFADSKLGGPEFTWAQQEQGRLNNGQRIAYAAGLFVMSWKGLREVSHSGATAGYRAWLARYPDQGLSVALLCNTSAANTVDLGHSVASVYLGKSAISQVPTGDQPSPSVSNMETKAGLYASVRDRETFTLDFKEGQLKYNGTVLLTPVTSTKFRAGDQDTYLDFEPNSGNKTGRLRVLTGDDENDYYEKVERVNPSAADLQALTGEYTSDEAETTLKIAVENGKLAIHRRPDATILLTPTFRDGFSFPSGSVRFIRGADGRVTEMSIGDGRVWDLRFLRRN